VEAQSLENRDSVGSPNPGPAAISEKLKGKRCHPALAGKLSSDLLQEPVRGHDEQFVPAFRNLFMGVVGRYVKGDKHLGLWELTPRPPPRMSKAQPSYTEPHIDYSDSQVPPSDNGFYVDPVYPADLLP
jgi:hypothetical protein